MPKFWHKYKECALMLLVTVLLLCAGIVFQGRVSVIMEADMEDKLLEITAQIRNAMDQKLESSFAVLHAVSASLEEGNAGRLLETQKERNGFTALGAVTLEGKGIFGPDIDKGYLALFTEAFRGHDKITQLEESPPGDRIFTAVPLMRRERVIGAVYAVYRDADLPGLSSHDIFGGQGISLLVGDRFKMAVPWEEEFQKLISDDALSRQANLEAGERMRQKLYQSRRGVEKFLVNGQETYLACVPLVSIPGWYAMTSIPATVVLKKIRTVILLMSLVVIGLCCALLTVVWLMENTRQKNRKKVLDLAYTDRLTGIDNWEACLHQRMASPAFEAQALAVLDIDEFHIANSLLGGEKCDQLLQRTAQMLAENTCGGERVCRIEADRFGLLLEDDTQERLTARLTGLMNRVSAFVPGLGLTLSAGVIRLQAKNASLPEALECCILAQKTGKREKRNSVAFYSDGMRVTQLRSRALIQDLPRALAAKELLVYLQPKVRLADGGVAGAEALARWQHPVYGFLQPAAFVPLLEEAGVITQLDLYMLQAVCRLLRDWEERGLPLYPVSVNLSRTHLVNPNLAEQLEEIVMDAGVSPGLIDFELTESTLFGDQEIVVKTAESLREKGFLLSVDDFGAGYSLLGLLPRLPAGTVKLDKSLLDAPELTAGFLTDMIAMINHLSDAVLAEGIEQAEQVELLLKARCKFGQGYYYARPMPVNGYERLLKSGRRLP